MGGIYPSGENSRRLGMKLFVISDAPIVEQLPFETPVAYSTSHEDMRILFEEIGKNPMVQMYEVEIKQISSRHSTHCKELIR